MTTELKTNVNRTVRLEPDGAFPRVVKRFHSPGLFRRLGDGRRARREFELLHRLHDAGLPVPKPLELVRNDGRWEVATEWIPKAGSLEAILRGKDRRPSSRRALAHALAELLARAYRCGLEHDDLHAGNVLVTADGLPWLIDLQNARIVAAISAARIRADLVRLCAAVRECADERFRVSFLRKLHEELPARLSALSDPERIEVEGRALRRERVERRLARWTRESGICRVTSRAFVRRDVDEESLDALLIEGRGEKALFVNGRDAHQAWLRAARLDDHGVPVTRPIAVLRNSERALFERRGARVLLADLNERELEQTAQLLGRLHDRGLATTGLDRTEFYRSSAPTLCFGPNSEVRPLSMATRKADWDLLVAKADIERLLPLYLEPLNASRAERRRVRKELHRG